MYVHIGTGYKGSSSKDKVNIPSFIENKAKSHEQQKMEVIMKAHVTNIAKEEKCKSAEIDLAEPEFKVPKIPTLKRLSGDLF